MASSSSGVAVASTPMEQFFPISCSALQLMKQSSYFYCCYLLTENLEHIHSAVRCAQQSILLIRPLGAPRDFIQQLVKALLRRFQRTRQAEDIAEGISLLHSALHLVPNDKLARDTFLGALCICFLERDGNLDGLAELNPPDGYDLSGLRPEPLTQDLHHEALRCLNSEIQKLKDRYSEGKRRRISRMEDLHSLIQLFQHARDFFASDIQNLALTLHHLAYHLRERFEERKERKDIMEACDCCSVFVELILRDPPNHSYFSNASKVYLTRFLAMGGFGDLEDAVHFAKLALDLLIVHFPNNTQNTLFADTWHTLGAAMSYRYCSTGDADELDVAIDALSRAADMAQGNSLYLKNLGIAVRLRHERSGRAEDLNEAIAATQRALECLPPRDPERIDALMYRSADELALYRVHKDVRCEFRALQYILEAWSIRKEHPHLRSEVDHELLHNTASIIYLLSDISSSGVRIFNLRTGTGETGDLIGLATELASGAAGVHLPSEETCDVSDIAIAFARGAASMDHSSPRYSHHLCLLGSCHHFRWKVKHSLQDLDEAISIMRRVVNLADAHSEVSDLHPGSLIFARVAPSSPRLFDLSPTSQSSHESSLHARWLLGAYLHERYKSTRVESDREEALKVLREGSQNSAGGIVLRILAAKQGVYILGQMGDWESARILCLESIDLFEILNGRSQEWAAKQGLLRNFSDDASLYAAIALTAGGNVLEVIDILERCRGTILGHLVEKQSDLYELEQVVPEKAQHFRALQDELNTASDISLNRNTRTEQIARRIKAEEELRACLKDIRETKRFQGFLQGPTEEELTVLASRGPIVIVNYSPFRADAIIITKDAFSHLPLQQLQRGKLIEYIEEDLTHFDFADFPKKNKRFRELLAWLWEDCVQFIFQRLQDLGYGPKKYRMWWIGTGIASYLPFHAAGKYVGDFSETALSRAISSYTPTLKILLNGYRKLRENTLKGETQSLSVTPRMQKVKPLLTVVTMPSTPGMRDLEVEQEAEEIQNTVGDTFRTQILVRPNAKETMAQIAESEVVHFACHGESEIEKLAPDGASSYSGPFNGRLLLQATTLGSAVPILDELNLRDIAVADLSHGKLAFLSACSTAESRKPLLKNEVLHLVSGFHVAGYLHTVGNLWQADDETSTEVVKGFYERLVSAEELWEGDSVARALNGTLIDVAKEKARLPLDWAQFVHFGI